MSYAEQIINLDTTTNAMRLRLTGSFWSLEYQTGGNWKLLATIPSHALMVKDAMSSEFFNNGTTTFTLAEALTAAGLS